MWYICIICIFQFESFPIVIVKETTCPLYKIIYNSSKGKSKNTIFFYQFKLIIWITSTYNQITLMSKWLKGASVSDVFRSERRAHESAVLLVKGTSYKYYFCSGCTVATTSLAVSSSAALHHRLQPGSSHWTGGVAGLISPSSCSAWHLPTHHMASADLSLAQTSILHHTFQGHHSLRMHQQGGFHKWR